MLCQSTTSAVKPLLSRASVATNSGATRYGKRRLSKECFAGLGVASAQALSVGKCLADVHAAENLGNPAVGVSDFGLRLTVDAVQQHLVLSRMASIDHPVTDQPQSRRHWEQKTVRSAAAAGNRQRPFWAVDQSLRASCLHMGPC